MKKIFVLLFLIQGLSIFSQINTIPQLGSDSSSSCSGLLLDPGGVSNYSSNALGTYIIDPSGNGTVSLTFSQFSTQVNQDFVKIYDGQGTTGTLLGTFSGTSLPNSGNQITSTSGAITVYFSSNSSINSSGFIATWSANDSTAPTSQFIASTSTIAFNTPLQFVNTSTNSGSYYWDFGDGSTSTDEHPFHSYTSSGVKQVYLISSNCFGSDTSSIQNITVLPSPNGNISTDTVVLSVPCDGIDSTTFVISNAGSGSGNLPYALELNNVQPNLLIDAQWEGTSLDGFTNQSTSLYTTTIQSNGSAPKGNSYLQFSGDGIVIRDGLVYNTPNATPTEVSYYVKSDNPNSNSHGYMLLRSSNGNVFFNNFNYGQLKCHYSIGGIYQNYSKNVIAGQWTHIMLQNIDYTTKKFDLYVDGTLVVAGATFYHSYANDIDAVHMYHIHQGTAGFDDFRMGDNILNTYIDYNPKNGTIAANGSQTITVTGDATNLAVGEYWYDFLVTSNDTTLDSLVIPLKLIVEGRGELVQDKLCVSLGNVFTNTTYTDSVKIENTGCDTLVFSNISNSLPALSTNYTNLALAPSESTYLKLTFNSANTGTFIDTVHLTGQDTSGTICFSATVSEAPIASVFPGSLNYTLNGCDTLTIHDTIYLVNSGLGTLHYSLEFGSVFRDTSYQVYNSNGATTQHLFSNIPSSADSLEVTVVLNGDFDESNEYASLSIDGTSIGVLQDNNTLNYDTITVMLSNPTQIAAWLGDNALNIGIVNTFNVNVFSSTLNSHEVLLTIYDNASWLSTSAVTPDSLQYNDTVAIPLTFNPGLLPDGTHTATLNISSNDPNNPLISVPVQLNIVSYPDIVTNGNCLNFGTVKLNSTYTDSLWVYNHGCADLILNGISFNNAEFSSAFSGNATVAPGDSLAIAVDYNPTTLGNIYSFMLLNNNDTNLAICLTSTAVSAPFISYDHTLMDICNGVINFTDNSTNNPTQWHWDFGDGNFSIAQNPTHVYKYPGMYQVKLLATNAAGTDSLTKTINATDILYADFVFPATNYINKTVQFTDSSKVGSTWLWYFGDGASSAQQNPTHTYNNTGVFNVSLTVYSQSCTKTINKPITIDGHVGLKELNNNLISLYPNPATNQITIGLDEALNNSTSLSVFSPQGEIVKQIKSVSTEMSIDVSEWSSGTYMFRFISKDGNTFTEKVMVNH